jgi:pectin-derived oligosaccharide transport system substrate-binding protein
MRTPAQQPQSPSLSRRSLLSAAGAAALAVPALAACGGGSSDGKADLTFWWWGDDTRAAITEKVLKLYTKQHPKVTFTSKWMGYDGYYDLLKTNVAGNTAPDIFQIDEDGLADFATRGATMDLSDAVGHQIRIDQFAGSIGKTGMVDGKRVAIPAAENTAALIWDKTMAAKYGVGALKEGMSWDDFVAWAAEITKASKGKVYGTADPSGSFQALEIWLRQRGKDAYDGSKLAFTADDLTEWWQYWVDAHKKQATPPPDVTHVTNQGDITKDLISSGTGATALEWSNQLDAQAALTKNELGITTFPGDVHAAWARASMFWSVYSGTKYKDQALDVVDFLVNSVPAGKILGAERGLAVNTDVRSKVEPTLTPYMKASVDFESALSSRFGTPPQTPPAGHTELRDNLVTESENVIYGRKKPAEAAKDFVNEAADILSG